MRTGKAENLISSRKKLLPNTYLFIILSQIPLTAIFLSEAQNIASGLFGAIDISLLMVLLFKAIKNNRTKISKIPAWLIPLPAYILWCLASAIWSISSTPTFDTALLGRDVIRCINMLLLINAIGARDANNSLLLASVYAAIFYAIVSLFTMSFSDESAVGVGRYSFDGFKDSVGVSRQAAILCILSLAAIQSRLVSLRLGAIGIAGCLLVCLLAFSKSAIFSLLVSTVIAYGFYRNKISRSLAMIISLLVVCSVFVVYSIDYITYYINSPAGLTNFSGRSLIWSELLKRAQEALLIGHGLNPVFTLLDGLFYKTPGTAHNDILQQVISYGVIGFTLWIAVQVALWTSFSKNCDTQNKRLILSLFIFFLCFGMTESVLVLSVFPVYFMTHLCAITAVQYKRPLK